MASTLLCPNLKEFERLIDGQLAFQAAERIAAHVEQCDHRVETLDRLEDRDTLAAAIRTAATVVIDDDDDSETQQWIEQMLSLATTAGAALHGSPAIAPADAGRAAITPEDLATLLHPATDPGELGRLGRYRILEVLGAGGMGIVFRAWDPQLNRPVALKAMRPALGADKSVRARFRREAEAAGGIHNVQPPSRWLSGGGCGGVGPDQKGRVFRSQPPRPPRQTRLAPRGPGD